MLSHQIQDVLNGIGTIKSVSNAPKNGYSMLMESVLQFLINVLLTTQMELVSLVIKDTTLSMEFVSSLPSTMPTQLTQDVPPGIGTTKSVSNVQKTGPSMLIKSVLLSLIFVLLMMPMELVSHASKDMT